MTSERFFVDHCVPAEVAAYLRKAGYIQTWTAYQARLDAAEDRDLIVYADERNAILVTTNRDCAHTARRLTLCRCVYLAVIEANALQAMKSAVRWLDENMLPEGRVLRIVGSKDPKVMSPLRE